VNCTDDMDGASSRHMRNGKCVQSVSCKHEGKTPSTRPRHRWESKIKIDAKETGCEIVDWSRLVEDCTLHGIAPLGFTKWWKYLDQLSD
jgi:hypothetical protein